MKNKLVSTLVISLLVIPTVMAFELIKIYPIESNTRQVSRIDGVFLTEDHGSILQGFFIYPEGTGAIKVHIASNNVLDEIITLDTKIGILDVEMIGEDFLITGNARKVRITTNRVEEIFENVSIQIAYDVSTNIVYITLQHEELEPTFVTFLNES